MFYLVKNLSASLFLVLYSFLGNLFLPLFSEVVINDNSKYLNEKAITKLDLDYLKKIPEGDYILSSGDEVKIMVSRDYPELTTNNLITGEGTIYLPRIHKIYVKGLTINELNILLNKSFAEFVKYPNVEVMVTKYRPIRIMVEGEVSDPGLKLIKGSLSQGSTSNLNNAYFPNIFDAIRQAGGITEFSDLSNIEVVRVNSLTNGGGYKKAIINFNDVIRNYSSSSNLRLYDGDEIFIKKLSEKNPELLKKALTLDLNPAFITVSVSGRVENPGRLEVPLRSTLYDAVMAAGGTKALRGKITLLRFNNDGTIDKRVTSKLSKKRESQNNPTLNNNDMIFVNKGLVNNSAEVISEFTAPFLGIFSTYSVIKTINN